MQQRPQNPVPAPVQRIKPAGRMMLKHRDGVTFINMEDILLVQREDRSTAIYTADGGSYYTSDTLSETEARLDPAVFFRCHRSYIINLNRIHDITPYGRWTYIVRLTGTDHDALITQENMKSWSVCSSEYRPGGGGSAPALFLERAYGIPNDYPSL